MRVDVGLIGAGIQNSLSPQLHEAEGSAQGLRYRYRLFDLDQIAGGPAALPAILADMRAQGFAGTNITFPVKQDVLALLDSLSPEAEAMQAVNTVRFGSAGVEGHNTDWWGFGESLRRGLGGDGPGHVVLVGAGGRAPPPATRSASSGRPAS